MIGTETTLYGALRKQAGTNPNNTFLIHKDRTYTFEETREIVDHFAAFLLESNFKSNDILGLMLPRIPELIFAFIGASKIGAVPAPINYLLSPFQQIDHIERLRPAGIITHEKIIDRDVGDYLARSKFKLLMDVGGRSSYATQWAEIHRSHNPTNNETGNPSDLAYLNYTTGSSGLPKGALATHSNIYWNTRAAQEAFSLTETDVHLCMFSSVAHPHELFARALYTGSSTVMLEELNPKTISKTISDHSVSCVMGLAPMYYMMAKYCDSQLFPHLRVVESGGMFTRPNINAEFKKRFGLPILSVWGSTETTGIALANTPEAYRLDGSMGKVCPRYEVRIVDEDGTVVTGSGTGELQFRGPGVISGYSNHDGFPLDEDWYRSGDIARRDKDGFFYFVDRMSGMLKVAGLKVYPLQVELVLLDHPCISEAAVIGINDRRKGVVPKAFIVQKSGCSVSDDEIQHFCGAKLPSYMIPKQVEFIAELPKIGSGKIDKKALLQLYSS